MKNRILLDSYYLPGQLEQSIEEFVKYYNNCRYHESLDMTRLPGHSRTEGKDQTKNHRAKTPFASAGNRSLNLQTR